MVRGVLITKRGNCNDKKQVLLIIVKLKDRKKKQKGGSYEKVFGSICGNGDGYFYG